MLVYQRLHVLVAAINITEAAAVGPTLPGDTHCQHLSRGWVGSTPMRGSYPPVMTNIAMENGHL